MSLNAKSLRCRSLGLVCTLEHRRAGRFVHPRAKEEPLLRVLDLRFLDLQFGGLLSGLYKQSQITDLLDELYYDGLRK